MSDPLLVTRAVHVAATMISAGALSFGALVLDPATRTVGDSVLTARCERWLRVILWSALAVALVSGAVWLFQLSAEISGQPLSTMFASDIVATVLTRTDFGRDWELRLALGFALVLAPAVDRFWPRSSLAGAIKVVLAAAFAGSLVFAGHGGATPDWPGDVHLAADMIHLIAAAGWLGPLIPLALLFAAGARGTAVDVALVRAATLRFSRLGVLCVGLLLITGIINTWFLAGTIPALVGTDYGRWLLVKITLFLIMVTVASVNRLKLTPRLDSDQDDTAYARVALRSLARNCLVEIALGLGILAIVGYLGTSPPGLHMQPEWPFPFRFAAERPLFMFLAIAAIMLAGGIFAFVGRPRIPRSLALSGSAIAATVVALSLRGAAVPAFPTTYAMSPIGYTAASIVHGEALFKQNCAACHTPGSAALAAEQLNARPDGDLFWFISHGLPGMPAFDTLEATAVWNLINYVRATADVARLSTAGVRAPDMTADCLDGTTPSLADLRGHVVHLIAGAAPPPDRAQALAALAPDVISILVMGDNAANGPLCTVHENDAVAALAIVSGREQGDSEFLIDQNGSVRALWFPGVVPAWTDTAVLLRSVAEIRANTSISEAPMPAHMHMH